VRQHTEGPCSMWWRCALAQVFAAPMDGVVFQESTAECGRACTRREMLDSRYCLVPDGVEGWSLRMYDSLVLGCVPVLIAGAWVGVRLEGTRVSRESATFSCAWTVHCSGRVFSGVARLRLTRALR
jgi:hypothetical protein